MRSKLILFPIAFLIIATITLMGLAPSASSPTANAAPLYAPTPITVQTIYLTGTTPSYVAASSDNNYFTNDGKTYVNVRNSSAGIITSTFITPLTVNGLAVDDLNVQIPANSGTKIVGPFLATTFSPTGTLYIQFSATSGLSLTAFTTQ